MNLVKSTPLVSTKQTMSVKAIRKTEVRNSFRVAKILFSPDYNNSFIRLHEKTSRFENTVFYRTLVSWVTWVLEKIAASRLG